MVVTIFVISALSYDATQQGFVEKRRLVRSTALAVEELNISRTRIYEEG